MSPTVAADAGPDAWAMSVSSGGGRSYFLNVPDGSFTVTVYLPNGEPVSQATVQTAGGTVTGIQMHPTASP